jgi:hypothetical protein
MKAELDTVICGTVFARFRRPSFAAERRVASPTVGLSRGLDATDCVIGSMQTGSP